MLLLKLFYFVVQSACIYYVKVSVVYFLKILLRGSWGRLHIYIVILINMNDFFLLEIFCHLTVSYQLSLPSLCDFPVHWNQVKKLHELVLFISIHIFVTSSSKQPCCTSENCFPSFTWFTLQGKSSLCECTPKFITDAFFLATSQTFWSC